jgi:hypothetical protein
MYSPPGHVILINLSQIENLVPLVDTSYVVKGKQEVFWKTGISHPPLSLKKN